MISFLEKQKHDPDSDSCARRSGKDEHTFSKRQILCTYGQNESELEYSRDREPQVEFGWDMTLADIGQQAHRKAYRPDTYLRSATRQFPGTPIPGTDWQW